ncbi:MAG: AAA family ATPase, partial [Cyanobacteria bacterium J06631_9]
RWFSFANEQAIAHKKLLGQIYQNELAVALQKQGYVIAPKAHGQFELVGYSPELLKLFSTRRQQIESLVALWEAEGKTLFGQDGRVVKSRLAMYEAAALKSRKRKPTPMQPEQLRQGWNALVQLEDLALPELPKTPSAVEKTSFSEEQRSTAQSYAEDLPMAMAPEERTASELEQAIQHCSERDAVFRRTALERFVFEHQLGQMSFEQLQQDIARNVELVQLDDKRVTTQMAIRLELETIRLMREGKGAVAAISYRSEVEQQISESLTTEQRQAIALVMTTPDAVMAWQGSAGVGKTYALNEVRKIARSQGYKVKGFAPSAEAAHTLGEALEIETSTVAGLLVSEPQIVSESQEPESSLWIIDEAGLLSMKSAHALLQRAKQENARVLLAGDIKQLSAVEAGNPFKSLQAAGITLATLDNSLRQKTDVLRVAVRLIAEGHIARGIDVLEQAGCLQIEEEVGEQINQMVSDYLALSLAERTEMLLLAGTNQERLALTRQLRQALQAEGTLGRDALTISSLRRKDLTQVQAEYLVAYQPGDLLMPTQDYKKQGLAKYQHYTVRSIDQEVQRLVVETADGQLLSVDPARCKRKTVYSAQTLDIAVGDRMRWTKNDRKTKTRNGQQFTVAEVLDGGMVRTVDESGQSQWFPLSGHQHVDYAWVSTTYGSQGKTADRVLALMSEKTTNQESFYVAVSRAKHGLKLYAADIDELLKRAQTSKTKENASDYIPLFKIGKTYAETEKENQYREACAANNERRNIGRHIGAGVGASVGERLAQKFAAFTGRLAKSQAADASTRTAGTGNEDSRGPIAGILGEQVESFSRAVADYAERADLIKCERDFADTVTAINHGFEQLEQAAENRNQFTAAVDQFNTAVRKTAEQQRNNIAISADSSGRAISQTQNYRVLWQHYQQGIQARSHSELDYKIGYRALQHGVMPKVISLMLASESAVVKQLHRSYGKPQAIKYVNQMTHRICAQNTHSVKQNKTRNTQVEMD